MNMVRSWSDFNQDLLFPIMMQLGPVDFYAFSGVCKSWRSLALTHKTKFMASRRPMSVSFSTVTRNECILEDFEGRKFKTTLPHSTNSTCVGLTCGYLIFYRTAPCGFWLFNPFTRRELHFPNLPSSFKVKTDPSIFRGILVFSPSKYSWMFVFTHKSSNTILYSVSGNQASWWFFSLPFPFFDIHSFKKKIYTISISNRVFELRLDPNPSLTLMGMIDIPQRQILRPEFVTSDRKLYVVSCIAEDVYKVYELDFEKMESVLLDKAIVEHAFFVGDWKSGAAVNADTWADRRMRCERVGYLKDADKSKVKGRCLIADMWYFPHDCFKVNLLE